MVVSSDPLGSQQARSDIPRGAPAHASWLYGPAQYELGMLRRIVSEGRAAGRFVHYVENHGRPDGRSRFRLRGARAVRFLPGGAWTVESPDSDDITRSVSGSGRSWVSVECDGRDAIVTVDAGEDASALAVDREDLSRWDVWNESDWIPAQVRSGGATPPHLDDEPSWTLPLSPDADGLLDAGATVLGRPIVVCEGVPEFSSGESPEEATTAAIAETRHETVDLGGGRWTTRHRLGFRYLAIRGAKVTEAVVVASVRPSRPPGVFVCSDDTLTRIAAVASWTLRTCLQGLALDGVKRDRMPWIGDQALATAVNAYTVADAEIVRDGLVALGRTHSGYVNGIADYSLWWVIGQGFLQRYFADHAHLVREAGRIHAHLEGLAAETGADAVFRPRAEGGFADASGSVLIDWGVHADPARDLTALQVLWFWALSTGADLLKQVDHPGADRWHRMAATLRGTLERRAFDPTAGTWSEYLDGTSVDDPYPYFLGLLCGLVEASETSVSATARARPRTPWMTAFALRALGLAGRRPNAVALLREQWTPMVDAGATTFWEEFARDGEDSRSMYGRPFGKSLSHAWSAGPAALLPELVLGIVPIDDGWARFSVTPQLGDLDWASAVVPTPHGDIVVSADRATVTIDVPAHSVLCLSGVDITGPARLTVSY